MATAMTQDVVARVRALLETVEAPGETAVKIVAVDGHGGSGKSTLAALLVRELGAEVVQTDDFASWEQPVEWWPALVERVLEPLAAGAETLSYPRSKWWPDHQPEPVVAQPVTPVMLLEGVTALRREFRPYAALRIWVETSVETCLARGLERDSGQGTAVEVEALWRAWLAAEDAYIARDDPRGFADLVVNGTEPF
jgi:uridine kinase